jgi:uncharacterized membrane protein
VEQILPRQDRRESEEVRWAFGLGGVALLLWGVKHRSWLGLLLSSAGADLLNRSLTGHYLHETLGVVGLTRKGVAALIPHQLGIRVNQSIAVYRPIDEAYGFFRNFKNFSRFMAHVNAVREEDETRSHWYVKGPGGIELEWDAEIINDQPNELIAWRSIDSPSVESTGSVRFERAPGERGTLIHVSLNYLPPAGALGAAVAKLMGQEPETQIKHDLRRLKQILEAGEIATTEGQSRGPLHPRPEWQRSMEYEQEGAVHEKFRAATSGATD